MTNRLVFENLKHRPVRTLLGVLIISIQVMIILALVGLSQGTLSDQAQRARGVGADIVIRPPTSSVIGMSGAMRAGIVGKVSEQPHVKISTGVLQQGSDLFNYVTGLDLAQFDKLSGGFRFTDGGPFQGPDDVMIDDYYARQHKYHVGDMIKLLNRPWHVSGIYEPGMLTRVVVPLTTLQDLTANTGQVSMVYIKLDTPSNTDQVVSQLRSVFKDYRINSMEEFTSLYSVNNVPMLREFTGVVIGLGVLVGFLAVFLSMYTAVLERTREIGILKALGASPAFVLNILLRETTLLAIAGSILGIALSFLTRWLIFRVAPASLIQAIVPVWWPIAGAIAIAGALLGALYPGLKAARQDAIEALAYD
ncbi:MAG TPA: FtsX-like permease family protein [Bryobacteraceae bacterium]|nr:FtsX-like permease family protein [Bryobacteraceae bacterium]